MNKQFYLLKIQLLGIKPPIYRRFVVPADITLDGLHDVIQIVMGWTDSHLYEFVIGNDRYIDSPQSREDGLASDRYRLADLIKQKKQTFHYLYDFGDNWEHKIVLEDSHYVNPQPKTELVCLEGKRACPPEDIGGPPGYFEFCNAWNDPNHAEHENYMEWIEDDYNSEDFDVDAVNEELVEYLQWS
jgi:hypothetical protein